MKKFLFSSYPDFSDNAYFIFKEMLDLKVEGEYVWLCSSATENFISAEDKLFFENKNVKFINKKSIKGIICYLISDFIFSTHGIFEFLPLRKSQTKINLWHGMPLKKIGNIDSKRKYKFNASYNVSNGKIFDSVMAQAFSVNKEEILHVGSPRNDVFIKKNDFDFTNIFSNSNETIIWMPTFRKTIFDYNMSERNNRTDLLGPYSVEDMSFLDTELKKMELNLLVKLHPMDELNNSDKINEMNEVFDCIRIMKGNKMLNNPAELYSMLGKSKALITDYSSVYFDYLILENPIGIMQYDQDLYKSNRGIIEKVESYFVGYKISSINSLVDFISKVKKGDLNSLIGELRAVKCETQSYDKKGKNSIEILKFLGLLK